MSGAATLDFAREFPLIPLTPVARRSKNSEWHDFSILLAYVTYAAWTNGFKGSVGGNDYMDATVGWVWGVQMETSW
jgi:maltoporin